MWGSIGKIAISSGYQAGLEFSTTLFPAYEVVTYVNNQEVLIAEIHSSIKRFNEVAKSTIALNFGVYPVTDPAVPISKMLDFAAMSKKQIKDDAKTNNGVFNEDLLTHHVSELKMISIFQDAILNKEFVAYYQSKFDATQKTIIGAEALVRWVSSDGPLISPVQFIALFEKSGQIQHLDFYMREQGFSIAMDDFGSTYSSLNTLSSIPLDVLKLDRGFLMATLSHEKANAKIIIRSVINLAHDLSLKVVAEGVETEEQYEFLKNLGCDFIQGYYFSKPLDEPHFQGLLIQS